MLKGRVSDRAAYFEERPGGGNMFESVMLRDDGGRVSRKRRTTQSTMAPLLHDFCYVPMSDLIGDGARTTRALILSWSQLRLAPDLSDYVERPSFRRRQGQVNPYHASWLGFFSPCCLATTAAYLLYYFKGLLLPHDKPTFFFDSPIVFHRSTTTAPLTMNVRAAVSRNRIARS
jgi:hypothetical protein